MITAYSLMPADVRDAVADLERRVVAHDGGRLKLEWGVLRGRAADGPDRDLVFWDGDRAVGFAGVYTFAAPAEIAGMVDPGYRRQGIASALLGQARRLAGEADYPEVLLVTPRGTAGGDRFAIAHGAVLDHSEHAMILRGEPSEGQTDASVSLRTATVADVPVIDALLQDGFGFAPTDTAERLQDRGDRSLVIEKDGAAIGYVRISLDASGGGVYGFVVDSAYRGRGIGGDVLRRLCRQLRAEGADAVRLEVAVDNPSALHLYTAVGFEPVTTEDYYRLPAMS